MTTNPVDPIKSDNEPTNSGKEISLNQGKLKTNSVLIVGIILFCAAVFGLGGYVLGRQSLTTNSTEITVTPSVQPTTGVNVSTSTSMQPQNNPDIADWQEVVNWELGISLNIPKDWQIKTDKYENPNGIFLRLGPKVNELPQNEEGILIFASQQGLDNICNGPVWMEDDLEFEGVKIVTSSIEIDGQTAIYNKCFNNNKLVETQVYLESQGINKWNYIDFRGDPENYSDIETQVLASIKLHFN